MNRAIQYRLYPSLEQRTMFAKTFGCCRKVYNLMLEDKKKYYKEHYKILHKLSTEIANQYDVVCVENLNMKAIWNKKFSNGKATLDNGYGMFLSMLEYKLLERGKYFVKVGKWYPSSQLCSCCGKRQKLKLSDKIYRCSCGFIANRDYNAAQNILKEGLRLLKEAS